MGALATRLKHGDVQGVFRHHADVLLAALVVSIVGMMVVPLPTFLLDLLLSANIATAVVVLMAALYVSEPLRIASFPTLLLLTTLFRLALNVSSTRLILLQADAGEVIRAFGEFVVQGNLVVGVVLFAVLTLIQYLVVSKGSERVAEVAARFVLDAMPGKQMAIDADVRAGAIDQDEARRRRTVLTRESQLYGSMDGAMKFVKGDAIAGIAIVVINLVAGLITGVFLHGLSAGEAARTYAILSIGDGLVAQVPALLLSTAAGLVVTRVSSEKEGERLASVIGGELFAHPRPVGIAAVLLAGLALVPGLPTVPFLVLATLLGALAWSLGRRTRAGAAAIRPTGAPPDGGLLPMTPVAVELAPDLGEAADACRPDGTFLAGMVPELRRSLHAELGVVLPAVRVRPNPVLPPGTWRVRVYELPVAEGTLAAAPGDPPGAALARALLPVFERHAFELLGIQETQELLDRLEKTHPALIREVVPKVVSPALVAEVLRRLVEERVSIRDLRAILGALADWGKVEKDPVLLAEYVRSSLRRQITSSLSRGTERMPVYVVAPAIEDAIRDGISRTQTGTYLALEPDLSRDILAALRSTLAGQARAIVVTTLEVRRFLSKLVAMEHPDVRVLSFQELLPEASIQPVGRVEIGAPAGHPIRSIRPPG